MSGDFFVLVVDLTGELVRHTCILYFLSEKNLNVQQLLVSSHLHCIHIVGTTLDKQNSRTFQGLFKTSYDFQGLRFIP